MVFNHLMLVLFQLTLSIHHPSMEILFHIQYHLQPILLLLPPILSHLHLILMFPQPCSPKLIVINHLNLERKTDLLAFTVDLKVTQQTNAINSMDIHQGFVERTKPLPWPIKLLGILFKNHMILLKICPV